jgi:hypothetical protein
MKAVARAADPPDTALLVTRRSLSARALVAGLCLSLFLAVPVATESEWCDDGSPPVNDYRIRQTGTASQTSAYSWLRSIDGDWLIELAWNRFGVDLTRLAGTTGGVADGVAYASTSRTTSTTTTYSGYNSYSRQ